MQACYEFVIGAEAVPTHRTTERRGCSSPTHAKPLLYFYAISFQSVNGKAYRQHGCYRIILFETGATLCFKAATVIKDEVSYGWQKNLSIADTTSFTGIEVHCRNQ